MGQFILVIYCFRLCLGSRREPRFHSHVFQDILHTCRDMCMKYQLKAVTPGASESLWIQVSGHILVDFTGGLSVCIGLRSFSSTFLYQHTCVCFCYPKAYVLFFLGKRKATVHTQILAICLKHSCYCECNIWIKWWSTRASGIRWKLAGKNWRPTAASGE